MSEPITLFVPGHPVSVNAMYGRTRRGGVYLKHDAFAWKQTVVTACLALRQQGLKPPLSIGLRIQGVRGDADNYCKLVFDGLAAALWLNDKHFQLAGAVVQPGEPGVWLTIEEVSRGASSLQAS